MIGGIGWWRGRGWCFAMGASKRAWAKKRKASPRSDGSTKSRFRSGRVGLASGGSGLDGGWWNPRPNLTLMLLNLIKFSDKNFYAGLLRNHDLFSSLKNSNSLSLQLINHLSCPKLSLLKNIQALGQIANLLAQWIKRSLSGCTLLIKTLLYVLLKSWRVSPLVCNRSVVHNSLQALKS